MPPGGQLPANRGQAQTDPLEPRFLDYPYSVDLHGVPRLTAADDHLRDLISQLLFTCPGERVNLPDFGVCIQRLVFEPSNEALLATAQFLISSGMRQWLGDRLEVDQVTVTAEPNYEQNVTIDITYTVIASGNRQSMQVQV